ncbi:hypothetical protein ACWGKQ_00565 [Streptomyces sp. NPDC054770]
MELSATGLDRNAVGRGGWWVEATDGSATERPPSPSPGSGATAPAYDTYRPDPGKAHQNKGPLVRTCQYADDYVRYYRRGIYTLTGYEAKIARKVGSTTVPGDGTYTCPAQNYFFQGDPKTRTQWLSPSLATFRKALAPWVNATRSWCGRS